MNTTNNCHAFVVSEAVEYGVDKAILLQHIRFWCNQNKGKETHEHNGRVYMYQSVQDMAKHYPYWSTYKIHRLLKSMEDDNLIVSGNFNKISYDRTKWYSINVHIAETQNGNNNIATPIPNTKQDTKLIQEFEKCWQLYKRKGNKATSLKYFKKLSVEDRKSVLDSIPKYVKSRERIYQKDFQGYINPANRIWEDEIVVKEEKVERVSL
tara:strand:+ start:1498 stop:2124 length:627 start_codon:yes stop_codon:yes gene_type:complete